jgi:hypothetical protein
VWRYAGCHYAECRYAGCRGAANIGNINFPGLSSKVKLKIFTRGKLQWGWGIVLNFLNYRRKSFITLATDENVIKQYSFNFLCHGNI